MKKHTLLEGQKQALTNFLITLKINLDYCIVVDQIKGNRFAVATLENGEPNNIISNFMTYQETNCFLFGVTAVKNNNIKF